MPASVVSRVEALGPLKMEGKVLCVTVNAFICLEPHEKDGKKSPVKTKR